MLVDPNLLLCYDGSDQATEAIGFAAALFPRGTRATVLHAWEPTAVAASGGMVPVAIPPDSDEQDKARALRLAEDGAQQARSVRVADHRRHRGRRVRRHRHGNPRAVRPGLAAAGQLLAPRRPARGMPGAHRARCRAR